MIFCSASSVPRFLQQVDDGGVRFENGLAFVFGQAFDEAAVVVERRVDFEAVFLAGAKVLDAMSRRRVNDAAALLECDVIARARRQRSGRETDV